MSQGSTLVLLCHFIFSINRGHKEYSLSFGQLKDSFADKEPAVSAHGSYTTSDS